MCTFFAALASLGRAAAATTSIDFDGFSVGTNNAAAQVGGRMTTWLNDPGGSQDGNVVANPGAGGTGNALFVATSDDVVLSLGASESVQGEAWGEVTATSSGTVNLAFDLYVPSGNYALWSVIKRNVQNARVDAVWLQYGAVNYIPGGENSGRISYGWGNGESYVTPSPALLYDQWVHVEQTLYVGVDTYALKINGTEAVSAITQEFLPGGNQGFGYESGLLGVEFEATGSDGTYYVDNITFNLASAAPVPEPASVTLLGLGLAGIAVCRVCGGRFKGGLPW